MPPILTLVEAGIDSGNTPGSFVAVEGDTGGCVGHIGDFEDHAVGDDVHILCRLRNPCTMASEA